MLTFVFSCIIIQSHYHYKNSKFKILNEINIIIIIIIIILDHFSGHSLSLQSPKKSMLC